MRPAAIGTKARRAETTVYLTVTVLLVVTGTLLRTVVLNWIVGPASVVIGVVVITTVLERRRADR